MVLFNLYIIIVFYFRFSINYMFCVKYCDCTLHESCISLIFMYNQFIFKTYLMNLVDTFFFFLLQRYPVHDLSPNCISKNLDLTIIFFSMGLFMGLMTIEGKHGPIDTEWVRFSFKHVDYPTKFHG